MSDTFNIDYFPTETAPAGTIGTAGDYASSFGGAQLPQAPAFNVQTESAAPAQTFAPTQTGYTPTFDFSPAMGSDFASAIYQGMQQPTYGGTQVAGGDFSTAYPASISPQLSQAIQGGMNISPIADILRSYGAPAAAAPTSDLYAQPVDTSAGTSQTQAAPQQGGLSDILKGIGGVKGLTSIAGGLLGYLANQRAQQQAEDVGNQIKAAYQNAAQQTQALAQPYITAGTPQLSMALQGALSPAQLQQYQAQQARLAQAAAKSGGIGAIQTAAAEQSAYQQALQNQQALALQLLAPGNELMSQAINQELQGTTQGLTTTLQYQTMANEAAAKLFQQLGSVGASTPQSQTNAGVA
jgi:hypothetical protein